MDLVGTASWADTAVESPMIPTDGDASSDVLHEAACRAPQKTGGVDGNPGSGGSAPSLYKELYNMQRKKLKDTVSKLNACELRMCELHNKVLASAEAQHCLEERVRELEATCMQQAQTLAEMEQQLDMAADEAELLQAHYNN